MKNTMEKLLESWPLSEYRDATELPPVAFSVPLAASLPIEAEEAIIDCATRQHSVLIEWVAPLFVVVEEIDPVIEDDEKADIEASGGDWRERFAQSFDVVVLHEFDDGEFEEAHKWLDDLSEAATALASKDLSPKNLCLFVNEDSRSTLPSAVVLFGVGGIDREAAKENRLAVNRWVGEVFNRLLQMTPLTKQVAYLPEQRH